MYNSEKKKEKKYGKARTGECSTKTARASDRTNRPRTGRYLTIYFRAPEVGDGSEAPSEIVVDCDKTTKTIPYEYSYGTREKYDSRTRKCTEQNRTVYGSLHTENHIFYAR